MGVGILRRESKVEIHVGVGCCWAEAGVNYQDRNFVWAGGFLDFLDYRFNAELEDWSGG